MYPGPGGTEWTDTHRKFKLGVDPDWPPLSMVTRDGKLAGIDADLLSEMLPGLALDYELVPTRSWHDTWDKFLKGEIDVTASTSFTDERAEHALFTEAYLSFPVALITRTQAPFMLGLRGLGGKVVASPAGHVTTAKILQDYPKLKVIQTSSSEESLRLVAKGKADAAIENLAIASHLIRTRGYGNLKIAGLTDYRFDLRFAVRKDWPELVTLMDRSLSKMDLERRNRILDRWLPVDYESAISWRSVWRGARWVVVAALVAVLLMTMRNHRLARELSERRRIEEALRQRDSELSRINDTLRKLNDEKDMLMHMAAHDLNNPLTGVMFAANAIEHECGAAGENVQVHVNHLRENTDRMARLIRNLLNIESEKTLDLNPVDLCTVLERVAARNRRVAAQKDITLGLAQQTVPPPVVLGNDDALDQVFDNLISNAVKYTPPGKSVSVQLGSNGECMRVEVQDQGPGIKNEDMDKLFRKFSRLGNRPTGGEKSTGLGLAIVKRLVEAMDGRVWCETQSKAGAKFIVEFPMIGNSAKKSSNDWNFLPKLVQQRR